ncbi:MAG: ABC transporter permease [Pseudomonadota bacterium]
MRKDLARWWQDRTAILIWLGIPFLIGGMITLMMDGGGGGTPRGILLIVDEDDTLVSGLIAGAFSTEQLSDMISVEAVSLEDGTRRINAGEASALMHIPQGFGDAILNQTPITVSLTTNPSQTILPGIITDTTEILFDAAFYAQALFGEEIAAIMNVDDETVTDVWVAALSVQIQNKIESLQSQFTELAIDLEIAEPPPAEPRLPLAVLFLPGVIMMAVLFAANSLAGDFWVERRAGTLRRLVSSPAELLSFVAGKAMGVGVLMTAIVALTLAIGFIYHDIHWNEFFSALLFFAIAGVGLFAWFAALQMLFANQNAAGLMTSILLFPLLMAGGSFFPLDVMPDWMAAIGRVSPNGFVVDNVGVELTTPGAFSIGLSSWAIMLVATALGLAICAWRLRAGFARQEA